MKRRIIIRHEEEAALASIATVLLVAIVVSLMTVVGMFAYGLVDFPEDPPNVDVVYTQFNDKWSIHVSKVSEEIDLTDYRLYARHPDGTYAQYDPDRDGTADALLAVGLEEILSGTGGSAQTSPIIFIDVDGDGKVSSGDVLIAHSNYVPSDTLFMDSTRGNKLVGIDPHGIPLDSDLSIVANAGTLATSAINPGDEVDVTIKHGGTVEATRNGYASASGTFHTLVYLDPAWHLGNHDVEFTVRPGEGDEWSSHNIKIKALGPDPPTPAEEEMYEMLSHPLKTGDVITLVHEPSGIVILEFRL